MDLELGGKVVLLVGGAGSIGRVTGQTLAAEGATVVVADAGERPGDVPSEQFFSVDVTDPGSVDVMIDAVVKRYGRIDVLVALAGVYQAGAVVDLEPDDWDRLFSVNLKGTFLVCRRVVPHMLTGRFGRIICIASLAGQVGGVVAGAHYAASKAGVLSLVKSLAKQVDGRVVTVNAVSPGPVKSAMTDDWPRADREKMATAIPVGRFATPQEVADVVTFLASPRAAYIHGARIDVNGGALMD
jgi:NAD(P)-dependent dehydrogenase (short-subunit alcohol dehydrogenase family)